MEPPCDPDPAGAARRRRLAGAVLVALGLAFVVVVAAADGSRGPTGRLGGDYPAFHAAGELVLDGRVDDLYDLDAQAEVQHDLQGDEQGFLAFAYPPPVALLYVPFAAVPYRPAYAAHTVLMVAALVAALSLLRSRIALLDREFPAVVAGTVTAVPVFVALGLGQNTALTLLLVSLVWRGLTDQRPLTAGLAAGLLWYRPQYGIPLTGLLLVGRQGRAVATAAGVVAVGWLVGAVMLGAGWVGTWLDDVARFVELDGAANAHNAVTPYGAVEALTAPASTAAVAAWLVVGTAAALVLVTVWHRAARGSFPGSPRPGPGAGTGAAPDPDLVMALTAVGLVVISNHSLFYDLGLVVPAVLLLAEGRPALGWRPEAPPVARPGVILALAWAAGWTQFAAAGLGVSPLALVAPLVFVVAARGVLVPRSDGGPIRSVPEPSAVAGAAR